MLAVTALCFALLAANSEFHQALHHGGTGRSNSCVLCLFAYGHVDSPQSPLALADFVPSFTDSAPPAKSIVTVEFTYLLSPSRAPPALAALLSAVA